METPNFKGTHLFNRLCWAKDNLEPHQSEYRVVYEHDIDKCVALLVPDPNWMACALQGGILPPIEVYLALAEDSSKPDFQKHTRGHLLHNTKPIDAMTEEQAIEYLIMKDVPQSVWRDYAKSNRPKLIICRKDQLPKTREWRNSWVIDETINTLDKVA